MSHTARKQNASYAHGAQHTILLGLAMRPVKKEHLYQSGYNINKISLWLYTSVTAADPKGFRLIRTKTEYMICDFDGVIHEKGDVSLEGQVVSKNDIF